MSGPHIRFHSTVFEHRVAFINDPEGNVIEFGEPLRKRA
jgi:extradiol dioxygenase family protein